MNDRWVDFDADAGSEVESGSHQIEKVEQLGVFQRLIGRSDHFGRQGHDMELRQLVSGLLTESAGACRI